MSRAIDPTNCIGDFNREIDANENVGGRIQIKLGYDPASLQLLITVICAVGLAIRANGAARNPYAKVISSFHFVFPFYSDGNQ